MSSPLKKHVSSLLEPLIHELVTKLGGLARFSSTSQEYATFFVFYRHKVSRYFDVNNI
jgi:hypothetical protein